MAKMIEDSLVKIGIIPDDTIKYIKSVTYISKKDKTIKKDMVEIEIKWYNTYTTDNNLYRLKNLPKIHLQK